METNENQNILFINRQLKHSFLEKNKGMLFLSVLCLTGLSGLNVYISILMQQIIDTIASHNLERVIQISLHSLASFILLIILYLIQRQTCPAFIRRATTQYKAYAFERLLQKSLYSVSSENTSKYLSMLTNDVSSIENNYLSPLFTFFMDIVGLVIAVIVMFFYSPLLAVLAIILSFLPIGSSLLCQDRLVQTEKTVSQQNESFVNSIKEILSGFFVIKTFQAEKEMLSIFNQKNIQTEGAKFHRRKTSELVNLFAMGAGVFAQLGIFIAAAIYSIYGNGITPGTVIIFLNLMNFIVAPITSIPTTLANRKAAFGLINKMANLLYEKNPSDGKISCNHFEKEIEIQHLNFSYQTATPILKDFNFIFEKGKSYAIVGPSGCGKSTLLNLLLGNCSTYDGQILIDDEELKGICQDSIYHLFSIIHQNVFIFNGSLMDNITLFRDYPKKQIYRAVQLAGLSTLVQDKGLDYTCSENGSNLSGGERQRISIARCLLHESPVLLVDEATASLDRITSSEVLNSLLNLQNMTKLVVTHSLEENLLKRFDQILTMSDGHVWESGTFDELMAQKKLFYSMVMSREQNTPNMGCH